MHVTITSLNHFRLNLNFQSQLEAIQLQATMHNLSNSHPNNQELEIRQRLKKLNSMIGPTKNSLIQQQAASLLHRKQYSEGEKVLEMGLGFQVRALV